MEESKIDSQRFGFKVAKINSREISEININDLINSEYRLIIARVDSSDVELINKLESLGFRLKDNQFTMKNSEMKVSNFSVTFKNELVIRNYKDEDLNPLVDLVSTSFVGYGHYFANKELDYNRVLEIYPDWARRSLTGVNPVEKIVVAELAGTAVGFLTFHVKMCGNEIFTSGGIGAVSSEHRGCNIFPMLLAEGLSWSTSIKAKWCEHNVLVTNVAVIRSMLKLGFTPTLPISTLHFHR